MTEVKFAIFYFELVKVECSSIRLLLWLRFAEAQKSTSNEVVFKSLLRLSTWHAVSRILSAGDCVRSAYCSIRFSKAENHPPKPYTQRVT